MPTRPGIRLPTTNFPPNVADADDKPSDRCGAWPCRTSIRKRLIPPSAAGINDYINPKKFQIIAAGPDNLYSTGATTKFRFYTSGINFTEGDRDNVSNFATGKLGDQFK